MTPTTAIEAWSRYRDGKRVTQWRPDELTVPMGPNDPLEPDPDYYGFCRVEEALTHLCKLRSQRETLVQLLVHRFTKGLPVRSFNGANYGWEHEAILMNTLEAIEGAVMVRIREVQPPVPVKSFEVA